MIKMLNKGYDDYHKAVEDTITNFIAFLKEINMIYDKKDIQNLFKTDELTYKYIVNISNGFRDSYITFTIKCENGLYFPVARLYYLIGEQDCIEKEYCDEVPNANELKKFIEDERFKNKLMWIRLKKKETLCYAWVARELNLKYENDTEFGKNYKTKDGGSVHIKFFLNDKENLYFKVDMKKRGVMQLLSVDINNVAFIESLRYFIYGK